MRPTVYTSLLSLVLAFTLPFSVSAQTIQDCLGAIEVCQEVYEDFVPPSGEGDFPNELLTGQTCADGESNSIWYTFTAEQAGDIGFIISPHNQNDDYDWALFNITTASCDDVGSDASLLASCNAAGGAGCHGDTGTSSAGTGNDTPGGCTGNGPLNALVPAAAGDVFVLMISNWTGSNSGYTLDFSESSTFTSFNTPPQADAFDNTCADDSNGYIEIQGQGGTTYDYVVLDENEDIVYECMGCSGLVTTDADLPAGEYTIQGFLPGEDCPVTAYATIEDQLAYVEAEVVNNPCDSPDVMLNGEAFNIPPGAFVTYEWTGPTGIITGQNVVAPVDGTYSLVAEVDGCFTDPVQVDVTIEVLEVTISGLQVICAGETLELLASGYGDQFLWENISTNEVLGSQNPISIILDEDATIQVTATSSVHGCDITDEIDIVVNPLPQLSLDWQGTLCQNDPITLTAFGLDADGVYEWQDDPTAENPRIITDLELGDNTFVMIGTSAEQCSASVEQTLPIFPSPEATFQTSPTSICSGQTATVTIEGTGFDMITWGDGVAANNENPATITIVGATTVEAVVSNMNGCSFPLSTQISPDPPPAPTTVSCGTATSTTVQFNWTALAGATSYTVTVTGQAPQTVNATTLTVTGLMPNQLVTIEVQPIMADGCNPESTTFSCSTAACPAFNLAINTVNLICLNSSSAPMSLSFTADDMSGSTTWSGLGITDMNNGTFNPQTAGVGDHTISLEYTLGTCVYTANTIIMIRQQPTSDFSISDDLICIGNQITVTYDGDATAGANYTWNFNGGTIISGTGMGPYEISWQTAGDKTISLTVTENGCVSTTTTEIVTVLGLLAAPVINCESTTTSIIFSWDPIVGVASYMVNLLNAPAGVTTNYDDITLTYTVSGLNAGESVEIQVVAVNSGPCNNTMSSRICLADDCPVVMVSIDDVTPICLDNNAMAVSLNAVIMGGAGGTQVWSGTGITDPNGTFNPIVSGIGTWPINVVYTEGNCSYNASTEIIVNAQPTANFTIDSTICLTSTATAIYQGSAATSAMFNWNFGTGMTTPGMGAGPHNLSWSNSGIQTISLTVTENNCTSDNFSAMVDVNEPLAEPQIGCDVTTSSITFSWVAIPNATGYTVNVLSIPPDAIGVYDDIALTYTVSGLNAEESVEIQVIAQGDGACGNSSQIRSCEAQNCPFANVVIDVVNPICLDATATAINLNAMITGGVGGGSEFWSGMGITDDTGVFDPTIAGVGDWPISLVYTEGVCEYNAMTNIVVNQQPSADFTVGDTDICQNQDIIVEYMGTATVAATYDWDFDSGNATTGIDQGPHTVNWTSGGERSISLTVTENDCASIPFSQMIIVSDSLVAPMIDCDSDNTSLTFSWATVDDATGYTVDVINQPIGATGTFDDIALTYSYTDLAPGDEITIQVNVLTDSPCGGVSSEMTCTAQSCDMLAFEDITFGPYCTDGGLQNLNTTIGDNTGVLTWSGTGVNSIDATFDPATSGTGMIPVSVQYELNGCNYDTIYQIIVHSIPVASFTITSPICVDNTALLTFDGMASDAAIYTWDLDGGTIQSGADPGPYTISWDTPGDYLVSLSLLDNGCSSESFSLPVQVDTSIAEVEITCLSTSSTEVTFGWNTVEGATDYDVTVIDGPNGVQSGNTYTITGLTPDQEVTIQVTASASSACTSSVATGSCIAQACQALELMIGGSPSLCTGDEGNIIFDFTTNQAGPFVVAYTINAVEGQVILDGDGTLDLGPLTGNTEFEVINIIDANIEECLYQGGQPWEIHVDELAEAGEAMDELNYCEGDQESIDLNALLTGAETNGVWSESSIISSVGTAFDATNANFNIGGQAAQTYSFLYAVSGGACPSDTAEVSVVLSPLPVADAGEDQLLSCEMGTVSLGGSETTAGQNYQWTSTNVDALIADPTNEMTEISSPGDYTLEVTTSAGCSSTDEVIVTAAFDVPVASVTISDISCFEANDGAIVIENIEGGVPPYTISLNGEDSSDTVFRDLPPGEYSLIIGDANSCFVELFINMDQPEQVVVELIANIQNDNNVINLGDVVTLQAQFSPNINIDTIIWKPDSLNLIASETNSTINISPEETSTYSVTIIDANGCTDQDDMTIIVQNQREIFVPSAFSPNDDGVNDILFVDGGSDIQEVKSFLVFTRWGEPVFENYNAVAGNSAHGWDGNYRGQPLNAAIFVYFAEVEFIDGEVVLFKGDVMLMR